jgi:hypothetical protein
LPQRGILCFKSLLGLKIEAPRFKRKNISATIVVDVKRFWRQIKTDEVFGTHRIEIASQRSTLMGIVRFALRLPHTFYVLAVLVLFLGATAVVKMPTDIFPEINIPVVTIIWQYTGLSTPEMEQRVTTYSEYSLSSSVNGIQDIEAQTLNGISVQKVFFQPDVNLDLAIAQIVAGTNSIRALLPTGIQPPIVVQYNASSVPVLQIALSSDTLNEQQLYDYGIYRLRQQLAPIHGITLPTPAGGKYRQIMVDIDPLKLQAKGLTPLDVVNAVNVQNLTVPAGTAKIGDAQQAQNFSGVSSNILKKMLPVLAGILISGLMRSGSTGKAASPVQPAPSGGSLGDILGHHGEGVIPGGNSIPSKGCLGVVIHVLQVWLLSHHAEQVAKPIRCRCRLL